MSDYKLNTIEEAIEDFREGKFVIVVDDEDRENEGDLIIAAEKVTPEKINFMLKHARGVLCAPITISRCEELNLPHQVLNNTSVLGTPFTVTIDKLEGCSTGVSAADRAATILALADPASTPETFGRPGHINPLYAQEKGVLRRAGHTEACVDMCRLAGLYPAAALMEIMSDDGTMARLPELRRFADEYPFGKARLFYPPFQLPLLRLAEPDVGVKGPLAVGSGLWLFRRFGRRLFPGNRRCRGNRGRCRWSCLHRCRFRFWNRLNLGLFLIPEGHSLPPPLPLRRCATVATIATILLGAEFYRRTVAECPGAGFQPHTGG